MEEFVQNGGTSIDLEEAVGAYLNCLSTGCAAGSKLYSSVVELINDKFELIYPNDERIQKHYLQGLQIQNAFEGYQDALLECKAKLLDILVENHSRKKDVNDGNAAARQDYAALAVRVAKELHCYHQTFADVLKPLLYSEFPSDLDNTLLASLEHKDKILSALNILLEVNKPLRHAYGLTNEELSQIFSWQHGEDLSESSRKKLNLRIDSLIQQYCTKLSTVCIDNMDIPAAFYAIAEELPNLLKDCCGSHECGAASCQKFPNNKEEIELMLHRELPRMALNLNGSVFEKANPGKAFENTTMKMRAVRNIICQLLDFENIDVSKEQVDWFCLRVLVTCCLSISDAASRTSAIMAFGKKDLVTVRPIFGLEEEKSVCIEIKNGLVDIEVPSKWAITENTALFASLCRTEETPVLATVEACYHLQINVKDYLKTRLEPLPVVHISKCVVSFSPMLLRKNPSRERSRSIKKRLSKATTKLFHRKSGVFATPTQTDGIICNEFAVGKRINHHEDAADYATSSSDDSVKIHPVAPPRPKRKARKSKKSKAIEAPIKNEREERQLQNEKKDDLSWFSSTSKFGVPNVPKISDSKDLSPSVASFEELQGVIDFLSASSSSSLCINEKCDKESAKKMLFKSHLRQNSATSLHGENMLHLGNKSALGKELLTHRKAASFSGKANDLLGNCSVDNDSAESLTGPVLAQSEPTIAMTMSSCVDLSHKDTIISSTVNAFVERTPGDGMDNKTESVTGVIPSIICDVSGHSIENDKTTELKNEASFAPQENQSKSIAVSCNSDLTSDEEHALKINNDSGSQPEMTVSRIVSAPVICDTKMDNNTTTQKYNEIHSSELPDNKPLAKAISVQGKEIEEMHCIDKGSFEEEFMLNSSHQCASNETISIRPQNTIMDSSYESQINKSINDISDNENFPADFSECDFNDTLSRVDFIISEEENLALGGISSEDYVHADDKLSIPQSHWVNNIEDRLSSLWLDQAPCNVQNVIAGGSIWSKGNDESEELEFTLDKQRDLHSLLEGSTFQHHERTQKLSDAWRGRQSQSHGQHVDASQERNSIDPWPLPFSNSSMQQSRSAMSPQQQLQQQQQQQHGRFFPKGSHSLSQQYPSSGGPYMRQNREQILAKKQILEKYAREQYEAHKKLRQYQHESSNQEFMPDTIPNHVMNPMVSRNFPLERKSHMPVGFIGRKNQEIDRFGFDPMMHTSLQPQGGILPRSPGLVNEQLSPMKRPVSSSFPNVQRKYDSGPMEQYGDLARPESIHREDSHIDQIYMQQWRS